MILSMHQSSPISFIKPNYSILLVPPPYIMIRITISLLYLLSTVQFQFLWKYITILVSIHNLHEPSIVPFSLRHRTTANIPHCKQECCLVKQPISTLDYLCVWIGTNTSLFIIISDIWQVHNMGMGTSQHPLKELLKRSAAFLQSI